jgi:hypothetical protein
MLVAAGAAAVWVLPAVATVLPRGSDPQPNPMQFALTATGLIIISAAYLFFISAITAMDRSWFGLALGYNACLIMIKFILSPSSFRKAHAAPLGRYLAVGLLVMGFYILGLWAIGAVARRHLPPNKWSWASKIGLAVGVAVAASLIRYVAAVAAGTSPPGLPGSLIGVRLLMPAVIAVACVVIIEMFDRTARPRVAVEGSTAIELTVRVGVALIVAYHLLWALYMLKLFG